MGVVTPATEAAVVEKRTGVVPTGFDLCHVPTRGQRPLGHHGRIFEVRITDGAVIAPAVSQRADAAKAQRHAVTGRCFQDVAGVLAASADVGGHAVFGQQDVRKGLPHFVGLVAHVLHVALTELACGVGTPTLGVAIDGQHASMVGPQGKVRSRAANREGVDAPKATSAVPIGPNAFNGRGDGEGAAAGGDKHRYTFGAQACRTRLNNGVADLRAGLVHSDVEETVVPSIGPGHGGKGQER